MIWAGVFRLTVSTLCREAGVHRTTFYSHYAGIADAVADVLTTEIDELLDLPDTTGQVAGQVDEGFQRTLVAAFAVITQDREAFRAVLGSANSATFREHLTAMFRSRRCARATERNGNGKQGRSDLAVAPALLPFPVGYFLTAAVARLVSVTVG